VHGMLACALSSTGRVNIEIVLARYDEDVRWIDEYRTQAAVTIYEKSQSPTPGGIHLENVGRESHTYLHHIVSRYDTLASWTVFAQAKRASLGYKGHRAGGGHLNKGVQFMDYLQPRNGSFFVDTAAVHTAAEGGTTHTFNFAASLRMSYVIDSAELASRATCPPRRQWSEWWSMGWFCSYVRNKTLWQPDNSLSFLDFFNSYVQPGSEPRRTVALSFAQGALFAVSARMIRARPKAYYERLLHSLSHNADPAYGYYMEWAWPIVFGRTPGDCPLPVRPERLVAYTDAMTRLENEYTEATGEKPLVSRQHRRELDRLITKRALMWRQNRASTLPWLAVAAAFAAASATVGFVVWTRWGEWLD